VVNRPFHGVIAMSKSSRLVAFVVLVAVAAACGTYAYNSAVAQDKEKPKEKAAEIAKWEYRIIVLHNDQDGVQKQLNELGDQGFEIAFVTGSHTSRANPKLGAAEASPVIYYTLKRAKK
jgi:hypothetical protein